VLQFENYFPALKLREEQGMAQRCQGNRSTLVGITEIVEKYIPISKRKARKFVSLYLKPKRIGNRIYVDRAQLEALLQSSDHEHFPLL